MRVDAWLREYYPGLSNRQIEEAIIAKLVVGKEGKVLKKGTAVELIDTSKLDLYLKSLKMGNASQELQVVYQERDWMVVDKPPGISCNPVSLFDTKTVSHIAFAQFPKISGFKEYLPKLCPHRLDEGTSGLLIVCHSYEAYEKWRSLFKKGAIKKTYLAWCWGKPTQKSWNIEFPIAKQKGNAAKRIALLSREVPHNPPVLKAKTEVIVMREEKDRFLARVEMRTGVTHQIRVHLSASGFPLVGDKLYDPDFLKRPLKPKFHALRAVRLELPEQIIEGSFSFELDK